MVSDDALTLPVGYYAAPDPLDPGRILCWRRWDSKRRQDGGPQFDPWPPRSGIHHPRAPRGAMPTGLTPREEYLWREEWRNAHPWRPWLDSIITAMCADPVAAAACFAHYTRCCCCCGKLLTEEHSKAYGVGPDCRRGWSAELLDRYLAATARHHAWAESISAGQS